MGDLVEDYVRRNYSMNVTFIYQEERLGLGHSIWIAREHITDNEPLLIILGDTIFDVDLSLATNSRFSTLGVKSVDDPRRFGVVELEKGFISRLIEKPENPTTNLALVGLYFINNPTLLVDSLQTLIDNNIRTRDEYQLTDALQMMIDKGEKFTTFPVEGWYDCGKPETLLSTNRYLLDGKSTYKTPEGAVIIPPAFVAENAIVERSVIGPYTTVASGATVIDSVVRDSIISDGATVTASTLEQSIIGNNAIVKGKFSRLNVGDSSEIDRS
jgi:glucose-1-phosphate thymidylyltransferase